jgi:predicted unusual protein kinase regulating ubiquinone biosynthesis (AarF/ABC1/UbiB family)
LPIYRWRRFLRISWFFIRTIAHVFCFDVLLSRWRLTRWYVRRSSARRWRRLARRFRGLAVQMGGVLIKLGQFLSARVDVLPAAITDELAGLQDEVPPAPLPYILATLVTELGAAPVEVFAAFVPEPVAAASLGQVYYGELHDGRRVAIKVQRPRIEEIVGVDLRAVHWAVRVIKNYRPIKRRADLEALFAEFERVLRQELDYVQEAHNAATIRANLATMPGVYIPLAYPDLTTRRVLVMERIDGIKISDTAALDRAGVDRSELAHRFYRAYLKQWFIDGTFHADPHPGNLFVRVDGPPPPPADGKQPGAPCTLIFVDFGMVGRLSPHVREALRDGAIAIATNDAERFVEALDRVGMILPGADRRTIVHAAQVLFRHTYDRSLREMSNLDVEAILGEVEHLVRDLPFQIPQDLIYIGRAAGMVNGLATTLDPDINLFDTLRPFAQELMAREQREGDWGERLRKEFSVLSEIVTTLPRQMDRYYKAANRGELQMRVDLSRIERGLRRVERAVVRLAGGIIATGLFVGGVLLRINGFSAEAQWAWIAAGLVALWVLWPRRERWGARTRRLRKEVGQMYTIETLKIAGYRDEPVPNTFFRQKQATHSLAILLPGIGYTCHMPLLYYPTQLLHTMGADVLWVEYAYSRRADFQALGESERERWFFTDVVTACREGLAQRPYQQITLIGKSIGTLAMGHLLTTGVLPPQTHAIWLTPLLRRDRLRAQIQQYGKPSLFVIGTADPHYDPATLDAVRAATQGEALVIDGADHSLNIAGDVFQSLRAIEQVVRAVQAFLAR